MSKRYWLMKTEPDVFSIDDLKRLKRAPWEGVRNYQARNFIREMEIGDEILFYHSSTEPPGVAGLAKVCRKARPDPTAWDPKSDYVDPKASPQNPIWMMVDVEFMRKFPRVVTLEELKRSPFLAGMLVIRRGMRLSIQPVEKEHFDFIAKMAEKPVVA